MKHGRKILASYCNILIAVVDYKDTVLLMCVCLGTHGEQQGEIHYRNERTEGRETSI